MGCGNNVSARFSNDGCLILTIDGDIFRICPGSVVSCDPNGLGIMIDGVLCPFPRGNDGEGNVVTSLSFDPDTLILTLEQSDGPSFDVNLDVLASDFYADSVTFDADTRELTITRTGGLPPLITTIPSDATELPEGNEGQVVGYDEDGQLVAVDLPDPQFPETGTPFFLLQRGAAGGVLTEGRLFLGTLSPTSAYPDDAIVPAVQGGAVDTAAFGRLRATADPDRITLAKRGNTGTLKAADAVEPDDLVTLAQLEAALPEGNEGQVVGYDEDGQLVAVDLPEPPADEDHYVESATFDDETRTLTLTRTDPLGPLTAIIPSDATELPEGVEGQVIGYDEDGQPVAMDLPEPPADEDHYVESATFDDETRTLTLTRTDPLADLTVEIPSDATEIPSGVEGQLVGYDANGDLTAVDPPAVDLPELAQGVLASDGNTSEFRHPNSRELAPTSTYNAGNATYIITYNGGGDPLGSTTATDGLSQTPNGSVVKRAANGHIYGSADQTITLDRHLTPKSYVDAAINTRVENAGGISAMRRMTQAAYDALAVKDPDTFYVIVG